MTKQEILGRLESLPSIHIFEKTERHLVPDTNPAFWEDYPEEMGTELQVERHAQESCEYKDIFHIFEGRNDFHVHH